MSFAIAQKVAAESVADLAFKLKGSVTKVHVTTQSGGHGVGTGVVVGKDLVATNCHVLANARGVKITKFGESYTPDAMRADWKHDLCILRFQFLELKPVELGDSENLKYEQPIFSIGFPGGPPKPQSTVGKIKALYPLDDSQVVRTDASFVMGASGSPVFDNEGKLIAISTFKSPGRGAYFYNIPVKWVKALLNAPETVSLVSGGIPFWDAPDTERPFFMRVVLPYQNDKWDELRVVAQAWLVNEPTSPEALFYAGVAEERLGNAKQAYAYFEQVLALQPQHPATLMELGLIANRAGKTDVVEKTRIALKAIDLDLDEEFNQALKK
ncbi:MAG TPA: trypsin-like peptidase domain-containing protein [Methylotenera sp.]|nr:trypsin-like peptidase domain-containing protein [Methylotenera sp.]